MFSTCPSVRLSVRYKTCEHSILKTNEYGLQIGTSDPRSNGLKQSTFGVSRSKVKVTRCQNRSQKTLLAI